MGGSEEQHRTFPATTGDDAERSTIYGIAPHASA
jgi:hypothetical protein